jgi:hypothetical protein
VAEYVAANSPFSPFLLRRTLSLIKEGAKVWSKNDTCGERKRGGREAFTCKITDRYYKYISFLHGIEIMYLHKMDEII